MKVGNGRIARSGGHRRCLMGQGAPQHSGESRGGGGLTGGRLEVTDTGEAPRRKKRRTVTHHFRAVLHGAMA
jgi:hypothetical protein